jgi:hypothetical protein
MRIIHHKVVFLDDVIIRLARLVCLFGMLVDVEMGLGNITEILHLGRISARYVFDIVPAKEVVLRYFLIVLH